MDVRIDKFTGCHIGIISHLRPANVGKISAITGEVTWYVGHGEGQVYRDAGARFVIESGGLCESRNAVLRNAFSAGVPAVQLSDDLTRLERGTHLDENRKTKKQISLPFAIQLMLSRMKESGAMLGGVAPTANLFYFGKETSDNLFIVGDFIVVRPCDIFFDEQMKLKEDYDYTLQHIQKYGKVMRSNDILATFLHRTNKGGACAVRTSELEQKSIEYLRNKWPDFIKDNPRRKDEILMRIPRAKVGN